MKRSMGLLVVALLGFLAATNYLVADNPATTQPPKKNELATLARQVYEAQWESWKLGATDSESVYRWSHRLLDAELASTTGSRRVEAAKAHLDRMSVLEKTAKENLEVGRGSVLEVRASAYYRTEAETLLANTNMKL